MKISTDTNNKSFNKLILLFLEFTFLLICCWIDLYNNTNFS